MSYGGITLADAVRWYWGSKTWRLQGSISGTVNVNLGWHSIVPASQITNWPSGSILLDTGTRGVNTGTLRPTNPAVAFSDTVDIDLPTVSTTCRQQLTYWNRSHLPATLEPVQNGTNPGELIPSSLTGSNDVVSGRFLNTIRNHGNFSYRAAIFPSLSAIAGIHYPLAYFSVIFAKAITIPGFTLDSSSPYAQCVIPDIPATIYMRVDYYLGQPLADWPLVLGGSDAWGDGKYRYSGIAEDITIEGYSYKCIRRFHSTVVAQPINIIRTDGILATTPLTSPTARKAVVGRVGPGTTDYHLASNEYLLFVIFLSPCVAAPPSSFSAAFSLTPRYDSPKIVRNDDFRFNPQQHSAIAILADSDVSTLLGSGAANSLIALPYFGMSSPFSGEQIENPPPSIPPVDPFFLAPFPDGLGYRKL